MVLGVAVVIFGIQKKRQGKGKIDLGTIKCKNCGYLERVGAEFCSKCGKTI